MSVGTVGSMKVRPDKVAEFEHLFNLLTATVRAQEPGNVIYQLVKVRGQSCSYKAIELYRDQAASDLHVQSAYLHEALPRLNACLDGVPVVERIDTVD
jgi:quinol monooxygenase YgiN